MRVRAAGRRAEIIENLVQTGYRVLFYPDPAVDVLDRDTPQDADEAGGILHARTISTLPFARQLSGARRGVSPSEFAVARAVRATPSRACPGMSGIEFAAD